MQHANIDRKTYELTTLFELSKVFNSTLDSSFVQDNLLLVIMGRMKISRSLLLQKKGDSIFQVVNAKGLHRHKIYDRKIEILSNFDDPFRIADIEDSPLSMLGNELSMVVGIPLVSIGGHTGYALFGPKMDNSDFADEEIEFIYSVANIAASAMENANSYGKITNLNEELDKKLFRLNTLFDLSKRFNSIFDEVEIAKLLGFVLMGELLVNRFFIYFKQNNKWTLLNTKGIDPEELNNYLKGLDFDQISEIVTIETNSGLSSFFSKTKVKKIFPITYKGETKCIFGLGESLRKKDTLKKEEEFLETLGNYTINALENASLFRQELDRKRIEEEMKMARQIQQNLLPKSFPILNNYQVFATNIPSYQVGGDLFDIIKLDETRVLFAIADVTGKGTPAALLMSNLQAALRTISGPDMILSDAAARINKLICQNTTPEKFITCFMGILCTRKNDFQYVNAGHDPPIWLQKEKNQISNLDKGGLLLGVFPDAEYEQGKISLARGDHIFFYTDGVTEAFNINQDEFGEGALLEFILAESQHEPQILVENLLSRISQHRGKADQSDDITLIDIKKSK